MHKMPEYNQSWMPGEDDDAAETARLTEAARTENEVRRLKADLKASLRLADRQRLELESLRGLRVHAGRVASEEAALRGKAWRGEDVLRFAAVSKAGVDVPPYPLPPSTTRLSSSMSAAGLTTAAAAGLGSQVGSIFHSDALRELMEQAIVATSRRLTDALNESSRSRSDAEKAEAESAVEIERVFPPRHGVEASSADQTLRLTVRGLLAGCHRAQGKMRAALHRLEDEARAAQAIHAADMRALAARLVAQREAVHKMLTEALRSSESDGEFSVAGLQAELRRLHKKHGGEARETNRLLEELQTKLVDTKARYDEERVGRAKEYSDMTATIRSLKAENTKLSDALQTSRTHHHLDTLVLRSELEVEEDGRAEDREAAGGDVAAMTAASAAALKNVEQTLAATREQSYAVRTALQDNVATLTKDKDAMEARMLHQLRNLENHAANQYAMLKTRHDALAAQVLSLKANSSRGRQMLYWSSMKAAGGPASPPDAEAVATTHDDGTPTERGRPLSPTTATLSPASRHLSPSQSSPSIHQKRAPLPAPPQPAIGEWLAQDMGRSHRTMP